MILGGRTRESVAQLVLLTTVLMFAQVGRVPSQSCAGHCPIDCPMHAKTKCHQGATVGAHRNCHSAGGPGLTQTGCTHSEHSMAAAEMRALVPTATLGWRLPSLAVALVRGLRPHARGSDPPDDPPPISAVL